MANVIISVDEMALDVISIAAKAVEDKMPNANDEEKQNARVDILNALAMSLFMY